MNGFDKDKFARAINRKLSEEGISVLGAARLIGIERSTFYRIRNAMGCADAENLLPICRWLNVPFEHFTTDEPGRVAFYESGKTLDKIEALINADANLEKCDRAKLIEIFRAQYQIITNLGKQ
jgi:hypothetical protein